MASARDPKTVKSALRILRVLEFFGPGQETASVTEICQRYGYPQSSISELLSCMVFLGFLKRDGNGRRYRPTARVSLMGMRAQPDMKGREALLPTLDQLSRSLDLDVVLATRVGFQMQIIHVTESRQDDGRQFTGDEVSLTASGLGRALLSTRSPGDIRGVVHRLNAEVPLDQRLRYDEFAPILDGDRRAGVSIIDEAGDMIGIAAMLPTIVSGEALAIGVRLPVSRRADVPAVAKALRDAVDLMRTALRPAPVAAVDTQRFAEVAGLRLAG